MRVDKFKPETYFSRTDIWSFQWRKQYIMKTRNKLKRMSVLVK